MMNIRIADISARELLTFIALEAALVTTVLWAVANHHWAAAVTFGLLSVAAVIAGSDE